MADTNNIKLDSHSLEEHARVLRTAGEEIKEFSQRVRSVVMGYDPANGGADSVGNAIDSQYYPVAYNMLDGGDSAGEMLVDLADLTINGARHGANEEAILAKLNDDFISFKMVPPSVLDATHQMATGKSNNSNTNVVT